MDPQQTSVRGDREVRPAPGGAGPLIDARHDPAIALRVEGLCKRYGPIEALAGVSFDVRQGEIFGLLGLNGAGKTTLISIITTERRPSAGDARLFGSSIRQHRRSVRQMIGVAPQEDAIYPTLTAAENLSFFGRIYRVKGAELASRADELLQLVGLEDRKNDIVATYSGGMKRCLNLAAALVHRPKLILLDEPTASVDVKSRERILKVVRGLRDDGNAILYTTHYMEEAEELCDRVGILHQGKLLTVGTLEELLAKLEFSEAIEIRGLPVETDLAPLRALGACHIERGNPLRLFVNHAAYFLGPLQKIIGSYAESVELKIVPMSLEHLFLYLTSTGARE